MTIITRFAPSPTGFLHIGGARTALFNYLFAKHHNGKFLLRIEDTDQARSTKDAVDAIFSSLKWLGLNWDGEVVFQSKRNDLYKKAALKLLDQGKAYYCFTPQQEIDRQRNNAIANKQHFLFESPWRDVPPSNLQEQNNIPVIRLKAPRTGQTIIHDALQGDVTIENSHLDDMVLLRSDGTATYMLAVVVDDHDMQISHIIRGDDHLTNAARQKILYQAFGWSVPHMVHIPLIHGTDGAKLSKRHGALGVKAYQDMGYLPESLCNYLLRLGWSHKDDEIISISQAIEWFNLDGLGKSPARLDFAKMDSLNSHYLRQLDDQTLTEMTCKSLQENYQVTEKEKEYIRQAMPSLKIRSTNLVELAKLARIYLINVPIIYSEEAKELINNCDKNLLDQVIKELENLTNFDKDSIQIKFKEIAKHNNIKLADIMSPIRSLMTGMITSPSVFEIIAIIGKENAIARLLYNDAKE
ncbi:glutamate--tRNA ligase [Rickettsia endosymbiont of Oedothorax gibbosus]|uniref:glutamate--tRNA ligase n=1 Tax=Rickettsia endosymbiont of Oedothorax gibbosus TaxID=931099 RepID=UPI002025427C|nr:glutamate--tRNA ligase [Rickettsia endosymbiont of Oedothorax gibbosus]